LFLAELGGAIVAGYLAGLLAMANVLLGDPVGELFGR